MSHSDPATAGTAELERTLDAIERHLVTLQQAVLAGELEAIDGEASNLQRSLARAVEVFMRAARDGGVPLPLKRRLAMASARVAAQRQSLTQASAALDRAIDVLIPGATPAAYTPQRAAGTRTSRGTLSA